MISIGTRRVTEDLIEVTLEGTVETVFKKRDPENENECNLYLTGSENFDDNVSGCFYF